MTVASHDSWMNALRDISDVLESDHPQVKGGWDEQAENFIDFCRAVGRKDQNAISAARGFAAAVDNEVWEKS